MTDYKEMTTLVPDWAEWCAVDSGGEIYVYSKKPIKWDMDYSADGGLFIQIGQGPPPEDWTQELYRLVEE